MRSLVILPTYNEHTNLQRLLPRILHSDPRIDVLVVDDNSPDGTGDLAEQFAAESPRVHVLHRAGKLGLGTAYVAGFQYALTQGYDRIVEMDADFSHRPEDLTLLLAASLSPDVDVVIGSRNVSGGQALNWSPLRHLVSKGGSLFARTVLGLPIHDCTSGFKVFRREVLERLDLSSIRSNGYAFQVEVNYACTRAGFQIKEVPIVFPDRAHGTSKMSSRIVVEAAWLVVRMRLGVTRAALRQRAVVPEAISLLTEHETSPA
jgi:dolichol-phosphate mannosyltransferase